MKAVKQNMIDRKMLCHIICTCLEKRLGALCEDFCAFLMMLLLSYRFQQILQVSIFMTSSENLACVQNWRILDILTLFTKEMRLMYLCQMNMKIFRQFWGILGVLLGACYSKRFYWLSVDLCSSKCS